jgi:hypothetical protein
VKLESGSGGIDLGTANLGIEGFKVLSKASILISKYIAAVISLRKILLLDYNAVIRRLGLLEHIYDNRYNS